MEHILDHLGLNVKDIDRSKAFYTAALAPLSIKLDRDYGHVLGFGREGKPEFWIKVGLADYQTAQHIEVITPVHVCFAARTRAEVDAFYKAAMAAGARDHGAPGVRAHYHANYYGAFVLDPDGHNVEAACHLPG